NQSGRRGGQGDYRAGKPRFHGDRAARRASRQWRRRLLPRRVALQRPQIRSGIAARPSLRHALIEPAALSWIMSATETEGMMPTTLGTMSGMSPLADPLVASDEVEGTAVFDASLERIGTVKNFMLTKREGKVSYVVISFGGFLGLGESHYPVPWEALTYDPELGGYVVNLERSRLAEAPTIGGDDPFADPAFGSRVREYWAS